MAAPLPSASSSSCSTRAPIAPSPTATASPPCNTPEPAASPKSPLSSKPNRFAILLLRVENSAPDPSRGKGEGTLADTKSTKPQTITAYHDAQAPEDREICEALRAIIDMA